LKTYGNQFSNTWARTLSVLELVETTMTARLASTGSATAFRQAPMVI